MLAPTDTNETTTGMIRLSASNDLVCSPEIGAQRVDIVCMDGV